MTDAGYPVGISQLLQLQNAGKMDAWESIENLCGMYPDWVIGVTADGTVVDAGVSEVEWGAGEIADVSRWEKIEDVTALYSGYAAVGLRYDGQVEAVHVAVDSWENIVAIDAGIHSVFALDEEGRVLCSNEEISTEGLTDIISIAAGYDHEKGTDVVYGLKSDGTVVDQSGIAVDGFNNIVAIDVSYTGVLIGLRSDGTMCISSNADDALRSSVSAWSELYVPLVDEPGIVG